MSAYILICILRDHIRGKKVSRDLLLLLEDWNFAEILPLRYSLAAAVVAPREKRRTAFMFLILNYKLSEFWWFLISHLTASVMVIDMLTLKTSMCIILIEVLLKRWLHAFFNKQRFYFELNFGIFTSYSRVA